MSVIGVDLADVTRISRFLDRYDDAVLSRVFTAEELVAARSAPQRGVYLSTCFGVKEAVGKALGVGVADIGWRAVEMTGQTDGQIQIRLSAAAARCAAARGVRRWHITASPAGPLVLVLVIGH